MDGDRLSRAKSIFLEALKRPQAERVEFLAEVCGPDLDLRCLVETLLMRDRQDEASSLEMPRWDRSAGETGETSASTRLHSEPAHPDTDLSSFPSIPGYRILRLIGEGGMGSVYEAEQAQPRRRVALKVIRGGAYVTEQQVRLFRREVESLARLNHPSIAAIYDAGRTPFGHHFFTMELVYGVPLSRFLAATTESGHGGRQELRRRLELFLQVCGAIRYAHQRGVIHRDLKPSNIFVVEGDREGSTGTDHSLPRVKVLDFGLARITDSDVSLTTLESETGKIQGTLAYMSPEQARGDPHAIDTRTDVYSLGIILYEILTGERPYDVQKTLIPEAVRVILEEEPRRPSAIRPQLRGDLETIVLKALEKAPEQRYSSVGALEEDVARYLAAQPILARPPTTIYQLRKLVARHRAPFAFAAVLFVVLLASTVTMSVLYERQRRERQRAEQETAKAERTTSFLQSMLSSVDPSKAQGREITVREILDEASKTIGTELADQPDVQATIQMTIGDTYASLLRPADAVPQYKAAYRTLRERCGEEDARTLRAKLALASITASWNEESPEGLRMLREVIDTASRSLGPDDPLLAEAYYRLGRAYRAMGQSEEAEAPFEKALEIRRRTRLPEDMAMVSLLRDVGVARLRKDDTKGARAAYEECLAMKRRLVPQDDIVTAGLLASIGYSWVDEDPAKADSVFAEAIRVGRTAGDHPTLSVLIHNEGLRRVARGDLVGAERCFRESWEILVRLYGEDNAQPGTSMTALAEVLHHEGKLDEAEGCYRRALRYLGWGDRPSARTDISSPLSLVSWPLRGYAELLLDRGDLHGAERAFRELVRIGDSTYLTDEYWRADARIRLGHCLAVRGKFAQAESLMVPSNEILQGAPQDYSLQEGTAFWEDFKSSALERLADLYDRWGKAAQAEGFRAQLARLGKK